MNYYALTVKKTTEFAISIADMKHDYEDWLAYAGACGLVLDKYVLSLTLRVYSTFMACLEPNQIITRTEFLRKGFHQHILKLESQDDIVRWMIYIHKDHENRFLNDQLLIESDPEYWRVRDELSKHKLEQNI